MILYLKGKQEAKNKQLLFGFIVLFVFFFVRIYGYLFGRVGTSFTVALCGSTVLFFIYDFVKLLKIRNIAYNPLINISFLFWFWTMFTTVCNASSIAMLVLDCISLSFGFLFFVFTSYTSRNLREVDVNFISSFSAFFIIAMGGLYVVWMVGDGDTSVPGALNSIYYCLLLLPIVFIQKNKSIIVTEIVVLFASVLLSGKRTAFIVIICALLLPFFFVSKKGIRKRAKNLLIALLIVLILMLVYNYIAATYDIALIERLQNIKEDGGSGRLDIYEEVIIGFRESSWVGKFFGHGFNGVANDQIVMLRHGWTTEVNATSAHNDFLEVLYDYGIVGLLLYLALIVKLIKIAVALKKEDQNYCRMFTSALIIFIVMSMFSHLIIYPTYIAFLWMFFSLGSIVCLKEEK